VSFGGQEKNPPHPQNKDGVEGDKGKEGSEPDPTHPPRNPWSHTTGPPTNHTFEEVQTQIRL